MGLIKCPRCELNYMLDTDKMCTVCRRDLRGEVEQEDVIELCSECGENPALPGQELCEECLKAHNHGNADDQGEDEMVGSPTAIGIDSLGSMDEIELDDDDDMDDGADFSEDTDEDDDEEDDE